MIRLLTFLSLVIFTFSVNAESLNVPLEAQEEIESATGILISNDKTIEKPVSQLSKDSLNRVVIHFDYDKSEVTPSTLATAFVKTKSGQIIFAPMISLENAKNEVSAPACPVLDAPSAFSMGQTGALQSLVETRLKLRAVKQKQIQEILNTDNLIDKLRKLEVGFGIQKKEKELSAELSPYELIDRLTRLEAAILLSKTRNNAAK